jgi:hypothetical protein
MRQLEFIAYDAPSHVEETFILRGNVVRILIFANPIGLKK